jgi:hypothetical protein
MKTSNSYLVSVALVLAAALPAAAQERVAVAVVTETARLDHTRGN